ncbi:ABC transporter permease [Bacillus sp. CGMCC 1.16607]|uniref:ABC transporter permease n=1 Tax=Bacillus sp. CGMCC 1.16607 TaxID=3351842 RepID=UPI00362ADFDE
MKRYTGLISKYLKHQRKRTLLTIIGIVLSVSLMIFCVIFVHQLKETIYDSTKYSTGFYHMEIVQPSEEQLHALKNHLKINKVGSVFYKNGKMKGFDGNIRLMTQDQQTTEIFRNSRLLQGKMPASTTDIVLEEWIMNDLDLELRNKVIIEGQAYQIVGIMKSQLDSKSKNTSLGVTKSLQALGNQQEVVYVQFKEEYIESTSDLDKMINDLTKTLHLERVQKNEIVYKALQEYNQPNYSSLFLIIVNLIVLILTINNIFSISVIEKIHQYGILRSIGTTPRQIRKLVLGEALLLGAIAIPIGVAVGLFAQRLLVYISFFKNASTFKIPLLSIGIIAVISLVTIIISAYRPALAAGRISPTQAMKMNRNLVITTKTLKKNKIGGILGVSFIVAWRNVFRNKTRLLVTTLSMSIGMVLFVLNFSFFQTQDPASLIRSNYLWDSNYSLQSSNGFSSQDIDDIRNLVTDSKIYGSKYIDGYISIEKHQVTSDFLKELQNSSSSKWEGEIISTSRIYGYDKELLNKANFYMEKGKINEEKLRTGEEVLIVESSRNPKLNINVGDKIIIGLEQNNEKTEKWVSVGAILSDYPTFGEVKGIKIVSHHTFYESFTQQHTYNRLDLILNENSKNHPKIYNTLLNYSKEKGFRLRSFYENIQSIDSDFQVFKKLMYGSILIIGLIGVFSIYNVILTSLLLRSNEFGMLRAIGMTMRQLNKMVVWEGAIYGLISIILGTFLSIVLSYVQFLFVNHFMNGLIPFWKFPFEACLFSGLVCLGISSIVALWSSKKLKKFSIIETIRNVE